MSLKNAQKYKKTERNSEPPTWLYISNSNCEWIAPKCGNTHWMAEHTKQHWEGELTRIVSLDVVSWYREESERRWKTTPYGRPKTITVKQATMAQRERPATMATHSEREDQQRQLQWERPNDYKYIPIRSWPGCVTSDDDDDNDGRLWALRSDAYHVMHTTTLTQASTDITGYWEKVPKWWTHRRLLGICQRMWACVAGANEHRGTKHERGRILDTGERLVTAHTFTCSIAWQANISMVTMEKSGRSRRDCGQQNHHKYIST